MEQRSWYAMSWRRLVCAVFRREFVWRKLADGLSFFMRHKESREAFEGLCMQSPEAKPWLPVVWSFAGDLIDWRFGAAEGLARDCGAIVG